MKKIKILLRLSEIFLKAQGDEHCEHAQIIRSGFAASIVADHCLKWSDLKS